MRKNNYVICVLMLLLAGYVFRSAGKYPAEVLTLGPAFFPELVAGLLVFFALALMIQTVMDRSESEAVDGPRSVFWVGIAAMAAYLLIMPKLGFLETTPFFLFGMGMYMAHMSGDGFTWWKKLTVSSLVTTGALYYLFAQLLNVPLP
jgi:hypothetical protein